MPLFQSFRRSNSGASTSLTLAQFLGDGSDGAVNFDGTNTYAAFATKSGSTYTLTRDMYAASVVVAVGVIVDTSHNRITATGAITNNGTIQNILGMIAPAGATAGSWPGVNGRNLAIGASGGAGGTTTTGAAGGLVGRQYGGNGGAGGAIGATAGGVATATAFVTPTIQNAMHMFKSPANNPMYAVLGNMGGLGSQMQGANGGGGGASVDASHRGGGGGAGGAIILLNAATIVNNGAIVATGGAGGASPSSTNGGGGGGGGGGCIGFNCTSAVTGSGTTDVTAGAGGAGVGTGANGAAGTAGLVYTNVWS